MGNVNTAYFTGFLQNKPGDVLLCGIARRLLRRVILPRSIQRGGLPIRAENKP